MLYAIIGRLLNLLYRWERRTRPRPGMPGYPLPAQRRWNAVPDSRTAQLVNCRCVLPAERAGKRKQPKKAKSRVARRAV